MAHISKLLYEAARIACIQNHFKSFPLDLLKHVYTTQFLLKDTIFQNDEDIKYRSKNNKSILDTKDII